MSYKLGKGILGLILIGVSADCAWMRPQPVAAGSGRLDSVLYLRPSGGPEGPQRVLDILAEPIPADSDLSRLPASWGRWTEDQRKTAPRQIAGRCGVLWTMMNSGGKVALLPAAQDPDDTLKLVKDVCIAAKMPKDWPSRSEQIDEAQRILRRSRVLGETLTLPPTLAP